MQARRADCTTRHGMALLEAARRCASGTTAAAISGYQQQLASISFLEDGKIIFRAAARAGLQHRPATALARLTHADSCSCRCTGWTIFSAALHPIEDSGFWALSADPSLSVHICNRLSRIVRMAHDAAEPCTTAHTQCHKCLRHPGACLTLRVWLARLSSDGGEAKCFSAPVVLQCLLHAMPVPELHSRSTSALQ